MKVKELIAELQKFDGDDNILLNLYDDRTGCDIYDLHFFSVQMDNGKFDIYFSPNLD